MDNRSKDFIFVPFCLLAQAFQAQGIVKNWKANITPIVEYIMKNEWNIIQMPCPESSFNGYLESLVREPKGLKYYNNEDFKNHCNKLADSLIENILSLLSNDYNIVAILGIENSPTCASSFLYTNKGTEKRKGIFMEILFNKLEQKNINIPFVGINRKSIKGCLDKLEKFKSDY